MGKKKEDKEKVATAVLSITAKQKKKEAEKRKEHGKDTKEEKMDVDEKKDEPNFEILQNPCRVVRPQLNVVNLEEPTKFKPIKEISSGGIILVRRIDGSECEIVEPVSVDTKKGDAEDPEPDAPEPFEYTE